MRYLLGVLAALACLPAQAENKITVTGEAIDTWCYFSGVMGGADAVVGSAHHTCALWCAAGGIPVGLLAEEDLPKLAAYFASLEGLETTEPE